MTYYKPSIPYVQMIETPFTTSFHDEPAPVDPRPAYHAGDPLQKRMAFILIFAMSAIGLFATLLLPSLLGNVINADSKTADIAAAPPALESNPVLSDTKQKTAAASGSISPIFATSVQYWGPQILQWAAAYDLDPDMVATVMQIESCGYPQAISSAGAQGLFQVMPFHFAAGENMLDPATNASRGMAYFAEGMAYHSGNVYMTFAGYNGGHGTVAKGWDFWADETQRYYTWSKGIYEDAKAGLTTSPTLQQWLQAGGASLCRQAEQSLQITQ